MAKMKKMLAAALAASMVMGLTACGGSSQPTETKAPESAKETEAAAEEQQRLQQPEMRKKRPVLR